MGVSLREGSGAVLRRAKGCRAPRLILDPATFAGIVISDHAAVYSNFSQSQKCWAQLLRKAITLTSKTLRGTRRQTVITSVIESLRPPLPRVTLLTVVKEITKWAIPGRSCFERLMKKHNLTHPEQSPLDEFPPLPASLQLQAASTNLPIISHDKTRTRAGLLALFV